MQTLFIDIETFGDKPEFPEVEQVTADDVKVGNIKDPEKIAAKIAESLPALQQAAQDKAEESFQKEWRGNAVKSIRCEVIAVSLAFDDGPVKNLAIGKGGEVELMDHLNKILIDIEPDHRIIDVVAHNGFGFDFPILRHRGLKYGFKHLYEAFNVTKYDTRAKDTQVMFQGSDIRTYYSMDGIAKFFGFEGKSIMTGAEVHDYFLRGEIGLISEYCGKDVEALRRLYYKMIQFQG
jgi:predicted PolB exonuclease-like 3'-5' exonuclease